MKFEASTIVRFSDCDPAGIVFYPQYFVMLNALVERWFDEALRIPYAEVIGARRLGLPTARLEVDFTAVSRHGDALVQALWIERLGRSSLTTRAEFRAAGPAGELRMRSRSVLVCTSLQSHRPVELPEDLRSALQPYAAA